MNTFGHHFRMTSFGESHGPAMGVVIDGCPSGVIWNQELLNKDLERRKPGSSDYVTGRNEPEEVKILSGVFEGKTLGTPIALVVENMGQRPSDYSERPKRRGHADDLWYEKFRHSDYRGGGRASGRETLSRVMAGSVAKMALKQMVPELQLQAWASRIGSHNLEPNSELPEEVQNELRQAKEQGESFGGEVTLRIEGLPKGWGQPVFKKLKSDFTSAVMGVGAVNGVKVGQAFSVDKGTDYHQKLSTEVYGGIRGGLSTGEPIEMVASVKPTSSITDVAQKGRHDPSIVPRVVPVLEAMCALVLIDHALWVRLDRVELHS